MKNLMPNLSLTKTAIVVSTYNRPDALRIVMESLLNQTVLPDEIIIADDGSTSQTQNLINYYKERFPNLITHVWQEDKGFRLAAIRNKAMAQAKSDYIIQIDGDIMLHSKFVEDHISMATKGYYAAGSRAMLSENLTTDIINCMASRSLCVFSQGVHNRLNAIRIPILMHLLAHPRVSKKSFKKIKGCHMAFWKEDFIRINGYNEDFEGWGSEDVEIELRFIKAGLKRCNLKFGALQYHLYHPENNKDREKKNEKICSQTRDSKTIRCQNGVNKYLQ
ncbi:MAG: glycosyltransferase family 2 protein [Breznakibacter sp.]